MIFSSGASYSNNFSTVMRSTWNAKLSVDAHEAGGDCRDPLPASLAKATVEIPAIRRRQPGGAYASVSSAPPKEGAKNGKSRPIARSSPVVNRNSP